jgi:hypothetical protein
VRRPLHAKTIPVFDWLSVVVDGLQFVQNGHVYSVRVVQISNASKFAFNLLPDQELALAQTLSDAAACVADLQDPGT